MGVLKVGHYPIMGNTLDHTYAILEAWGNTYRLCCYGGTSDSGNEFPANYYKDRSIFYTRGGSKTGYQSLECNAMIALCLMAWGGEVSRGRFDYDRRSGGSLFGDSAGILYAVTGVCHQMCNTITYATNVSNPSDTLINWPISLNLSKLIYGNRGNMGHAGIAIRYVETLRRYYGSVSEGDFLNSDIDTSDFASEFDALQNEMISEINSVLNNGIRKEERVQMVKAMLQDEAFPDMDALLEADYISLSNKNEFDNALLRGEVSNQEYANKTNAEFKNLAYKYAEILGEEKFQSVFESSIDDLNYNLIDVNMMLDSYDDAKRILKL